MILSFYFFVENPCLGKTSFLLHCLKCVGHIYFIHHDKPTTPSSTPSLSTASQNVEWFASVLPFQLYLLTLHPVLFHAHEDQFYFS